MEMLGPNPFGNKQVSQRLTRSGYSQMSTCDTGVSSELARFAMWSLPSAITAEPEQ